MIVAGSALRIQSTARWMSVSLMPLQWQIIMEQVSLPRILTKRLHPVNPYEKNRKIASRDVD
jgi:hypothetical protein